MKNEISHERGENILLKVSKSVREDFLKEYYGKILNKYKYFNINFSKNFLNDVCIKMKEMTFGPGEIIYSSNDNVILNKKWNN